MCTCVSFSLLLCRIVRLHALVRARIITNTCPRIHRYVLNEQLHDGQGNMDYPNFREVAYCISFNPSWWTEK